MHYSILSSINSTQRRGGWSCLDRLHNRNLSRFTRYLNPHIMNEIMRRRINLVIEHVTPLYAGLLILCSQTNCSHKMGATQVNGSSYTLSSGIPMIEARLVPKLRLSKIDKLGNCLKHIPIPLDRCYRMHDTPIK